MVVRLVTNPPPFKTPDVNPTVPADAEVERWARAYLRHAPLSLVLREINRLVALESVADQKGPVLDVGCGDGFWWQVRKDGGGADNREVYGIDISASEIAQAKTRIHASLTDVSRETPFAGTQFREIIGNCSLEHVPDIDAALLNLRHAAADGARLLMFVPTPKWAYQGRVQQLLLNHAPRLAMTLSGAANGFFQHWHLYNHKVWQRLLEQNGWRVRAAYGLGSARSEFLFRLFLPPAFAQFIAKQLTGFYPAKLYKMLPDGLLSPLAKLVRWAVTDPLVDVDSPHAYEYLIIAETAELPAR